MSKELYFSNTVAIPATVCQPASLRTFSVNTTAACAYAKCDRVVNKPLAAL